MIMNSPFFACVVFVWIEEGFEKASGHQDPGYWIVNPIVQEQYSLHIRNDSQ